MTDNVIHLVPDQVGDGAVVQPDQMLENSKGNYRMLVIVGETEDGEIQVCGSHSSAESLLLLAWAQQFLVNNRVMR